jgi:hypothetical protein
VQLYREKESVTAFEGTYTRGTAKTDKLPQPVGCITKKWCITKSLRFALWVTMKSNKIIERARKFAKPFCVTNGSKFKLKDYDPTDTLELKSEAKARAKKALQIGVQELAELQDSSTHKINGPSVDLSGYGRCRQRWGDQACDVRR